MNQDDPRTNQQMSPLSDEEVNPPGSMLSPIPGRNTSPIRPENPDPLRPRLTPSIARPTLPEIPSPMLRTTEAAAVQLDENLSPAEKAQHALDSLRQKITGVVQEYAEGRINQAQFHAIYRRYSEQREITERLLQRNPESGAWQSVIQPGHTGFLRDHFSAKVLSYGLYKINDGEQIVLQGKLRLPREQLMPILSKLKRIVDEGRTAQSAYRKLKDGSWVVLVPGRYTASVIIFSLEPASVQRQLVDDIQRDFERANEKLISRGNFDPAHLVFPHRTLFE